jgi:FtsZ-binding cell division protein ZapB
MSYADADDNASAMRQSSNADDELVPRTTLAPLAASSTATTLRHSLTVPLFESEALESAIARLRTEQKTMREKRKQIHKELKNAEKRRSRLKKRARQLSDADLVAVLQMRAAAPGNDTNSGASASTSTSSVAETTDERSEDAAGIR